MTGSNIDEDLRQLRDEYRENLEETVETLETHARGLSNAARMKTSFPVLLYLTHQIKGTAGTLGFPEVSKIARDLATELEEYLANESPTTTREEISRSALDTIRVLKTAIAKS